MDDKHQATWQFDPVIWTFPLVQIVESNISNQLLQSNDMISVCYWFIALLCPICFQPWISFNRSCNRTILTYFISNQYMKGV